MGARTQVKIIHGKKAVYLYSHYDSGEILGIVQKGLKKGVSRWTDHEYLSRILFCEMIKDDVEGLLGYGIGVSKHGDLDNMVTIDPTKQTISFQADKWDKNQASFKDLSFKTFCENPTFKFQSDF